MPIYEYQCKVCKASQDLWLDAPPPNEITGGECNEPGQACLMVRSFMFNTGMVEGAGFSPARNIRKQK